MQEHRVEMDSIEVQVTVVHRRYRIVAIIKWLQPHHKFQIYQERQRLSTQQVRRALKHPVHKAINVEMVYGQWVQYLNGWRN